MQKLMLTGNELTELPAGFEKLENLELLRLSDNLLTKVPECLFAMKKLAWVALGGNPIPALATDGDADGASAGDKKLKLLELEKDLVLDTADMASALLGEGTSGKIMR